MISVITPTYNRAYLLPRLYESLCRQTYKDFEWIIVDDGSTDDTETLVNSKFISQSSNFNIRYFKKKNGGKHTAVNMGVKLAKGELFFIADSDDMLPANSLGIVNKRYWEIREDQSFAGVCGLDGDLEGRIIGSGLPEKVIDGTNMEVRFGRNIKGDMKEVFRTSVLREFPFPEIEGERFCPETLVWNRIGTKYKLHYFSEVIYLAEYQPEGITASITRARIGSPVSTMMTYQEMTTYKDVPFSWKIRSAINYWRFRFCYHGNTNNLPSMKWYYNVFAPIGLLMHKLDSRKIKE